jgi:hypothetical protein
MFSAIILPPTVPVATGASETLPGGLNFAVTVYLDKDTKLIRVAATMLSASAPPRQPRLTISVRWFAAAP